VSRASRRPQANEWAASAAASIRLPPVCRSPASGLWWSPASGARAQCSVGGAALRWRP